jgi:uncharacterized protein (DUF3820 family)
MLLKSFLKERSLLTDELANAIDEYYKNMRNNNRNNKTMPFGKYKGCDLEEVKKDTKYCKYLLTTSVFEEGRFSDIKQSLYN